MGFGPRKMLVAKVDCVIDFCFEILPEAITLDIFGIGPRKGLTAKVDYVIHFCFKILPR